MIPYLLAAVGGYLLGDSMKDKNIVANVVSNDIVEDEDEITTWKNYADKDGYDSVFGEGEKEFTEKDIKDAELRNIANQYKANYKELNAYIPKLSDDDKEELNSAIDNEGFDYALSGYSDWKEIKDAKFQQLRKQHNSIQDKLNKFLDL